MILYFRLFLSCKSHFVLQMLIVLLCVVRSKSRCMAIVYSYNACSYYSHSLLCDVEPTDSTQHCCYMNTKEIVPSCSRVSIFSIIPGVRLFTVFSTQRTVCSPTKPSCWQCLQRSRYLYAASRTRIRDISWRPLHMHDIHCCVNVSAVGNKTNLIGDRAIRRPTTTRVCVNL